MEFDGDHLDQLDNFSEVEANANQQVFHQEGTNQQQMGRETQKGKNSQRRKGSTNKKKCWKRDSDGIVLKKGRKKMLEFLSVKRAASEHSSLPGGILEPGEKFPRRFKQIFNITLREEIDEKLKCGGQEVYKGYIDDGRNTDNAWIETTAINIHFDIDDELIESFNQVCLQTATSDTIVTWLLVDQNISVHDSHKPILQMVATFYGAHY
ncbi:transient receptor potential cation channel subfamily M member 2-like [Protopterus annectens]|uniref:transient receptor potential cation channel subfamily M member 2-like n=1 Tax=Protopterus annectens TaxID=7888 RepID=UPI001CFA88B2|nr:transient receptor potential cation channel subfamily M member 2-like [Protopterus annectens]